MDLECAICCNLLAEEPDLQGPPLPPKRVRKTAEEPVAGPSSGPKAPELCVPRCGHMFHKRCLINWVRSRESKTCPSCRKPLTERQLTTVYLPAVNQEEKKCEKCEITRKTLEQFTADKEQLTADKEQLTADKDQLTKEKYQLTADKEQFKKLLDDELEQRKGEELMSNHFFQLLQDVERRYFEKEEKVDQLTAEKEQLKMLLEEEVERRKREETKGKKREEVSGHRMEQLIKEKTEVEGNLVKAQRKVGLLEQNILELNGREREVMTRRENLHRAYMDVQATFLQERDKVEEMQGTLDELRERHRLLMDDVEDMRRKYESEQEKANILEGRVASLEVQVGQEEQQNQDSWETVDPNDSDLPPDLDYFKD